MISTVYTETKNNKWLIRQGCHNSGKQITAVMELKKYVKNSKASYENDDDGGSENVAEKIMKRYLTDRWFSRIVGSLGRSYVLRHLHSTYTW